MTEKPVYTEFHPSVKFILRELSSIFVAFFVVITLFQIRALG